MKRHIKFIAGLAMTLTFLFANLGVASAHDRSFASSATIAASVGAPSISAAQVVRPTLRRGATGPYVEEAQRRLNLWIDRQQSNDIARLPVTGYFGYLTETAVRRFQTVMGLRLDGVIDSRTWAALPPEQYGCDPNVETCAYAKIYLIALEDNGRLGKPIGCGDSIVPEVVTVPPGSNTRPLTTALKALLANKTRIHQPSGLYNALYQSNLQLASVVIRKRTAIINLSGDMNLGGVCDDPRFDAQIEETALQFPSVDDVELFINGRLLFDPEMDG